jgi:hypothetical protein
LRELIKRDGVCHTHIDNDTEMYMVRNVIWKQARMKPMGGCLCIACLEKRLGRRLKPKDFDPRSPFENTDVSHHGTPRLLNRRGKME